MKKEFEYKDAGTKFVHWNSVEEIKEMLYADIRHWYPEISFKLKQGWKEYYWGTITFVLIEWNLNEDDVEIIRNIAFTYMWPAEAFTKKSQESILNFEFDIDISKNILIVSERENDYTKGLKEYMLKQDLYIFKFIDTFDIKILKAKEIIELCFFINTTIDDRRILLKFKDWIFKNISKDFPEYIDLFKVYNWKVLKDSPLEFVFIEYYQWYRTNEYIDQILSKKIELEIAIRLWRNYCKKLNIKYPWLNKFLTWIFVLNEEYKSWFEIIVNEYYTKTRSWKRFVKIMNNFITRNYYEKQEK